MYRMYNPICDQLYLVTGHNCVSFNVRVSGFEQREPLAPGSRGVRDFGPAWRDTCGRGSFAT